MSSLMSSLVSSLLNEISRGEISQRAGIVSYSMLSESVIFPVIKFLEKYAINQLQGKAFLKGVQEEQIHV